MKRGIKTAALTEVNRHILEVAVESPSGAHEWDFFCECGRADCYEHVNLTVDQYVSIRDTGGDVLATGHRASQTARAERLREEAKALRAQAEHQLRRAKNTRGGDAPSPLVRE
ncbi:MAG: hypothetical protein JOY72_11290 [Actinobacteria bacterium]|nr:hypothetical protein [Actinomycetota bacterium]